MDIKYLPHRIIFILTTILLFGFCYKLISSSQSEFKISDILGSTHPSVINYNKYLEKYNDENKAYLLVESKEGKKLDLLKLDTFITDALINLSGLEKVRSLSTTQFFKEENKRLRLEPFIIRGELKKDALKKISNQKFWQGTFTNKNKEYLLFEMYIRDEVSNNVIIENLIDLKRKIENKFDNHTTHLLGSKFASFYFNQELRDQQKLMMPLIVLVIILILYFYFRSISLILINGLFLGIIFASSLFIIFLLENGLNPYTNFSLLFVFVIATADIVHLFQGLNDIHSDTLEEQLRLVTKKIWKPCLLTSLTTALALFSLLLSPVSIIQKFGLYSALGVILCFLITIYLLPKFLLWFNINTYLNEKKDIFEIDENKYIYFIKNNSFRICIGTLVIFILSCASGYLIKFDDSLYNKFTDNHPLSTSVKVFDHYLKYTGTIDLIIKGNNQFSFKSATYERIERNIISEIESLKNVEKVRGVSSYMNYIREETRNNKITPSNSFEENIKLKNIFGLFKRSKALEDNYKYAPKEVKLTIYVKSLFSSELSKSLESIEQILSKYNLDYNVSGFAPVRTAMLDVITIGFVKSFVGTLIMLILIFIIVFKSIKWGLIAMIPNIMPIGVVFIILASFGILVEDFIILSVCVLLGLSVDDTLHFLINYFKNESADLEGRLKESFKQTHKALIKTTFIFVAVTPCYFVSSIALFHKMAIVMLGAMVMALIADFIIVPGLLIQFNKENRK